MSKPDLAVETVEVGRLTPDPLNARRHTPRNLDAIRGSLARFGQRRPLVVTPDYVVVAGNGALAAARELGWTHVAVTVYPGTEEEARAFALADNRTAELAEWDSLVLLESLEAVDLEGTGFDLDDLADLRVLMAPPDLDELAGEVGDPTDEDGLALVRFKVPPEVAGRWAAACAATGLTGMEAHVLAIQAAYDALTDGSP